MSDVAADTFRSADTFRENLAIDEETGAAANHTSASNNTNPSSNPPQVKSRIGWVVAGTAIFVLIIGLGVGLSNDNGSDEATVAAAASDNTAISNNGPAKETVLFTSDDTASDNGAMDTHLFALEESVGDSALLNWPEVITASSPTLPPIPVPSTSPTISPTNAPSNSFEPTNSPSASPSMIPSSSPSASPSNQPTLEPSNSPTNEPTNSPTSSPSSSPSKTPTASPFNFSSWTFSAFGVEPSATPSKQPTLEPSTSPSKNPTSEPTKQPTPEPSASPSEKPTNEPSKQPTNEPSKQPTKQPTFKPTPNPVTGSPTTSSPTSKPSPSPTQKPVTASPTISEPFFFGDEFLTYDDLGIEVSRGLSVRLIARTGERVQYADGDQSKLDYHSQSDAAGIIPLNPDNPLDDGYVYVVNSEEGDRQGGVYGLYFDKDGNVADYKVLLTDTTDNCGGGLTPWNTWVSCEEYEDGQCWQVDPVSGDAQKTKLGGNGGRYESVAVDNTNTMNPVFFTTEDDEEGAMRRFVANGNGWDALHSNGDESFLRIIDDNTYEWTTDEDAARESAAQYYRNSEGVQHHEGKLYFMAKKDLKLIILDLENMSYEMETTGKKFYGEGSFGNQPDQNMFGPTRKYIYFTEDGGNSPGVYARYGKDGTYFTLFQAISGGIYDGDETVGIALSPDNRRFYAGIQDYGVIFEFTRDDGLPFE